MSENITPVIQETDFLHSLTNNLNFASASLERLNNLKEKLSSYNLSELNDYHQLKNTINERSSLENNDQTIFLPDEVASKSKEAIIAVVNEVSAMSDISDSSTFFDKIKLIRNVCKDVKKLPELQRSFEEDMKLIDKLSKH